MRVFARGQYFYVYTRPELRNELYVEEKKYLNWIDSDLETKVQIFPISSIIGLELFPDLFEVHVHLKGYKVPKEYKLLSAQDFHRFVQILQSGLHFELT